MTSNRIHLGHALLSALLLLAACGGSSAPEETEPSVDATGPAAETAAPSGTTGGSTGATSPDPAAAFEDRLEARIELDFPDRLLVGFDSLWIHTDDQHILRIDPATNEMVAAIPVGSAICQGSGLGEGSVWSCADNELVRIDPSANEIDLETDIEMLPDQWSIGVGEGAAWVLAAEGAGETLLRVDARTGEASAPIGLGHACAETAVAFGSVWVSCPIDGVVLAVDAQRGRVIDEVPVAGALAIGVGPDAVWVGSTDPAGGVARIEPETLEAAHVAGTTGPGETGAIWVDGTDVWVRSSDVFLTHIDAESLEILEEIPSPQPLGGGAVTVAFGSVWASSYDFFQVVRLRP